ncbi:MogA/MoaB family molybdenum cofactor biosynthesis protein [uncultured Ilyobacter sp.]|uniref:MogA/MoaB family molybdenum cofactor biosynthesis protein n=1 Tax=uncultured Ilyobacter sp. TaxID=544433 RepID=UPI0029C73854|nr:MogA/MoaB family molybdenum cofactor biosynthesis protein [uncultured Ilyobacter sp.]
MFKATVICLSDKGYRGERDDKSSQVIINILEKNNYKVVKNILLPDDYYLLKHTLAEICDAGEADLILTTGGTGFSKRDITPEATLEVIEKNVPGIPEAIRAHSMLITKRAMLSRAVAGIRSDTLIVNLPGSPKAVKESLEYIISTLHHGLKILTGKATECADDRNKNK